MFDYAVGDLGLMPDDFWRLTYSEFKVMVDGHNKKQKYELDKLLFVSWHTAAFERQQNLPSLNSLLGKTKKAPKKTNDEIMRECMKLNIAFGGDMKNGD